MKARIRSIALRGLILSLFTVAGLLVYDALSALSHASPGPLPAELPVHLPTTLQGASRAVCIEREPITAELRARLEQGQQEELELLRVPLEGMTYLYHIHYTTWDGTLSERRTCLSSHAYAQAYAAGETLVLTNSGAEAAPMALALLVEDGPETEMELPAPGPGGKLVWHRQSAWRSSGSSVSLQCGTSGDEGMLQWYYDAEKEQARFEHAAESEEGAELAASSRPFLSLGIGELGASGSSIPLPADAAAPTKGAEELPTTHLGGASPLRVECLPLMEMGKVSADELCDEQKPRFRYSVCGPRLYGKRLNVSSRYRYGQAFVCGDLLLLTTSDAHDEYHDESMSFIIVDLARWTAREDVLLPDSLRKNELCSGVTSVCWDGVDEEGQWIGGQYSTMHWHHAEAVSGSAAGISVRLGGGIPHECRIIWEYDAASAQSRLYERSFLSLCKIALPHRCVELSVEVE